MLTQQIDGKEVPLAGMVPLGRELYQLAIRYPTYASFSTATMAQLFGQPALDRALHYQVDTFASVVLHNEGGGAFTSSPLPKLAQIAPIKAIVVHDFDGDGNLDLLVAGNLYDSEPNTPRADAGNGLWLRGDGRGGFVPVGSRASGFLAPHNARGWRCSTLPPARPYSSRTRVIRFRRSRSGRARVPPDRWPSGSKKRIGHRRKRRCPIRVLTAWLTSPCSAEPGVPRRRC